MTVGEPMLHILTSVVLVCVFLYVETLLSLFDAKRPFRGVWKGSGDEEGRRPRRSEATGGTTPRDLRRLESRDVETRETTLPEPSLISASRVTTLGVPLGSRHGVGSPPVSFGRTTDTPGGWGHGYGPCRGLSSWISVVEDASTFDDL